MKKLLLITLALVIAAWAFAQTDITIGTGTSTGRYPFNDYFMYSRSQCIYLESEIGYPGTIHKLRWYRSDTGADTSAIGTTQIWLKTVPNAVFTDANWEDPGTLVYEIANIDLGAGGGWYEVDITDFNYTGGNLVVSVYTQDAPYTTPHSYWYYTSTTGYNRCRLGNSDSVNPPTLSLSTARPNIQINMTTSNPTSAPNPAVLVSPVNGSWAMIGDILSWNSGGGFPSSYDVYFGTSSTPPLVSDNQTTTTYTPTLTAGNTYYWKVVPANAFGEASDCPTWSFKTPTATQLAESFENTSFPPAGWANPGSWSRSTSYAKHGTASAYKYGSSSSQYILSTPKVTITSTSTLNFWSLCSSTSGILQIVYSPDRTTWTQIGSDITYAATYTMYNTVVDLSSLAGNNYYLGFRTAYSGSYYVDFVLGPEITSEAPGAPTLSTPADLATNVNELTTFTWTVPTTGGVPTGYKLYCDTNNPPTTLKADLNALTYTLTTPLAYNTTYYWTVLAYNGAGNGPTATVRSFTTRTDPTISTFPYTAGNFENGGALPLNWVASEGATGASYHWTVSTGASSHGPAAPHSGTYFGWLYCYLASTTYNPYYLTTPPIALDATAKRLNYWYWIGTGTYTEPLFVEISTDNQATWTTLYTHSNTSNTLDWFQNTISLEAYASHTVYLRFKGMSNYGSGMTDLGLDDIVIEDIPAAPIISCTPTNWDFGQTIINTTKTKDFTISNSGGGTLNVSSIAIAGDYYTLLTNPAPVGLAAGQSAIFTVQYAPTASGTHNGTVTITDNRGTTIVNLSAVCYDPTITTFPWVVDFGTLSTDWPVLNWSQLSGLLGGTLTTGTQWFQDDFGNVTTPVNKSAKINIYGTSRYGWLITPPIAIPDTGYELKFDVALTPWNGTGSVTPGNQPDDRFIVLIDDNPNMSSPTILREWNNTGSTYVFDNITNTGLNYSFDLSSYVGTYYFAFYGESTASNGDNDLFVDNVTVRETPAAPIFSYTPASINFGSVQQNHPATPVNVIVTNTGGGTLNLSSSDISITGPNAAMFSFSSTNLPAALGAGQSVNIPVSVTVTQEGPVSATLSINYNSTNYDVALSAEGLPAGTVIIGTGTSTQRQPFGTLWGYERSAALYTNAQIGGYGLLDKVAWNCAATTTTVVPYKIYAMQTSDTAFTAMSWNTFTASATLVDEGTHIFSTTGWHLFELDTPFSYVSGNLIVAVETYYGGSGGGSGHIFYYSTGAANSHQYWYADTTPPTGTGTLNTSLPNIMLQFGELPVGAPDPVTLTYPANGAVSIPQTGFNLTWTRALTGGTPSYYVVYMSQDETTIYDDYYWETPNTHFNPVTEGGITFNYLDRWYWTVEAVNDDGNAVVDPPYSFEIMADPRVNIPYAQDFGTNGTWPLNWTQTYSGGVTSNRWTLSNTNNAGGTAYEMKASWASGTGISRLIAPPINTDGIANFAINFNTYYNDYGAGITAKVQYSFDLNTWYDTPWSIISGSGDVTGNQTALITGLVNHPTTYVAWVLDGNHYQFNYWYIDDVAISLPHNHDVTVVSYDVENQVVPENTVVTPMATVGNNGLNTETFAVTCTIGTYSSTQTVSGLAMGATQQVTFAPITPALWTAESVEITTNLVGDEVPDNDTFYSALICLPLNVTGLANNAQTDQFVQFNLANPGVLNALPNSYTGSYFIAGADWKNGQWLGVEYDDGTLATDNYVNINPLTGIYTDQGDLGAALMGNAWDDTHDIMYGVADTGYLYVMDPATGAIGVGDSLWYNLEGTNYSLANIGGLMIDIAYDNTNNILYGIDLGNDCLWTINPATYELTLVGFLGIDLNYAQDAAFDQENGLLYLAGYAGGGALYWLDTTYGGAYKVGNFTANGYELTAFAIPYGALATAPVATISGTGQLSWTPVTGAVAYNVYSADDPYGTFTLEATVRGTTYTGPSAPKKFYKVTAVGGRQLSNHQEIRFREPIKFNGKLNQNDRYDFGPVNGFSMRSK